MRFRKLWAAGLLLVLSSHLHAGRLELSWSDNSNNEAGFEIERSVDGEVFEVIGEVGTNAESYTDSGVTAGIPYSYRVRAYNEFGYSGYTNVSVGVAQNSAPVIGDIASVEVLRGETDGIVIPFDVSDDESSVDELSVEVISSNLEILPLDHVSVTLSESGGVLSVTPITSVAGSSVLTVFISDGAAFAEAELTVSVLPNFAPTVSDLTAVDVYNGMLVGPIEFTVSDRETPLESLSVTGVSSDETKVKTGSIEILGSGETRLLSFETEEGASGVLQLTISVSDGVTVGSTQLSVNIERNAAPILGGLDQDYRLEAGQSLLNLAFTTTDVDTAYSDLEVSVRTSNSLLFPQGSVKVSGTGGTRMLSVVPSARKSGTATITVSLSDGVHVVERAFEVTVLPPDLEVKMVDFRVEGGHAVAVVENRSGVTFTLWKTYSLVADSWQQVSDAEVVVEGDRVYLVDPELVDAAVCYQVIGEG